MVYRENGNRFIPNCRYAVLSIIIIFSLFKIFFYHFRVWITNLHHEDTILLHAKFFCFLPTFAVPAFLTTPGFSYMEKFLIPPKEDHQCQNDD